MPKEQVNYPKEDEPIVSIHWQKATGDYDGHVQVSIQVSHDYLTTLLADHSGTVFSGVLDRAALNRGIQVGRRARDEAYGKDA